MQNVADVVEVLFGQRPIEAQLMPLLLEAGRPIHGRPHQSHDRIARHKVNHSERHQGDPKQHGDQEEDSAEEKLQHWSAGSRYR